MWENASRVEDCTSYYIRIPRKLLSEQQNVPAGSVVQGSLTGITFASSEDPDETEYSSTVKERGLRTRLVKGTGSFDFLFIFQNDWKWLSKLFTKPGRKWVMFLVEKYKEGGKMKQIRSGTTVYWDESHGNNLEI